MTAWHWQYEWNREFARETAERAAKSDVPPVAWMAGGKKKGNPKGEDRTWWNREGPIMSARWETFLGDHPDWYPWEGPSGELGIELSLEFMAGGGKVKCIPDRVYQTPKGLVLVDLKSGARKPDAGFQLPIQQLAMDVVYGEPVAESYYWMARTGELLSTSPVKYNRALLEDVFATAWEQIKAGIFLPNPGSQCGRCDVAAFCDVVGGRL